MLLHCQSWARLTNPARTGLIACRRHEVGFIHHKRAETTLPQIAAPALAEVDPAGVTPMAFTDGSPQTILRGRRPGP
jgi:hypothetical protein